MKITITTLLLLLFVPNHLFAQASSGPIILQSAQASTNPLPEPFGLKSGLTKAQVIALVGKESVREDKGDSLTLSNVPSPHPDFELYAVGISSSTGVARILAVSKTIDTNVYGDNLKEKYRELVKGLESKYGPATKSFDFLQSKSIWNEGNDWMMALLKEERDLMTFWQLPGGTSIHLEAKALSTSQGYVTVEYQFPNFDVFARERNDKKNASF